MTRILDQINKYYPVLNADGSLNADRRWLGHALRKYDYSTMCYLPSEREVEAFRHYYAHSDEYVRQRYFPERRVLWEQPIQPRPTGTDEDFLTGLDPVEAGFADFVKDHWKALREAPSGGFGRTRHASSDQRNGVFRIRPAHALKLAHRLRLMTRACKRLYNP